MQWKIIGDIQGCYTELQELVDKAGLASDDAIIALGDLVDRGPASPQIVEFFLTQPNAHSLMGNHERKHVRAWRGEIQPAFSQRITCRQCGEARYPTAVAFMATLPPFLDLPEALLVHAHFEPHVPLAAQRENVLIGTRRGEAYLAQRYDRPWYELYDGEKPIIVGHHDYTGNGKPFVYRDRVFGIDTGCCFGGALTGLLLPEFRYITVPARKNYWAEVQQQYAEVRAPARPEDALGWDKIALLLARAEAQPWMPPAVRERLERVQASVALAEQALEALRHYLEQEDARIVAQLRMECAFDQLPPPEQGRRYAARLGQTPLAALLHQTRKGALHQAGLRRRFKTPGEVIALARQLGLLQET